MTRAAVPFLLLVGCDFAPDTSHWTAQRSPAGPCWDVNLGDGVDESSTTELHDLYACIDRQGTIRPLHGVDEAMDSPVRSGRAAGQEVAGLINTLPSVDLDIWSLADTALALLNADEPLLEPILQVAVELLFGKPWGALGTLAERNDPSGLDAGVLSPAMPVISRIAALTLDDQTAVTRALVDLLEGPGVADGLCTLVGLFASPDPALSALAQRLPEDLGVAIQTAKSPENDRWEGASGDSIRDAVFAFRDNTDAQGRSFIDVAGPAIETLLGDPTVLQRLTIVLDDAATGGHLDPLPLQLRHLIQVDTLGGSLSDGEDSALVALVRLLSAGNTDVSCSLDLWVTSLDVDLGNLSVQILELMAEQDPDTVEGGVDLLGQLLGWGFSQTVLEEIADSGVCPTIDRQLVDDLQSLDRFNDPEVGDLLVVLLDVLGALKAAGEAQGRIPELVVVLDEAHRVGLVKPAEEALRDLGATALAGDLTELVPAILDDALLDTSECPTGSTPLTVDGLVDTAYELVLMRDEPGPLRPLVAATLDHDGTWTAIDHLSTLLVHEEARLHQIPALGSQLIALDPDLSLLRDNAALLAEPALIGPVLMLAESDDIHAALLATSVADPGPLPWVAGMMLDGTFQTVLRTIDLAIEWLNGLESSAQTNGDLP